MRYFAYSALICLFAASYFLIAKPYPYYTAWDSSMFIAVDSMIAASGQIPDHFYHPNTIPLVLNRWIFLPLGKELGLISVSSILALQKIPNPYLAFAETTTYLIGLMYFFVTLFLVFFSICIHKILQPINQITISKFPLLLITISILGICWGNLPHQLYWIRYETMGLTFWSIALFFTIQFAYHPEKTYLVWLAGLFSGAAILSKIQFLGGVAVLPFIYGFLSEHTNKSTKAQKQQAVGLLFILFVAISLTHASAYYQFTHHTLISAAFTRDLQGGHFFPLAPISLLILTITAAFLLLRHITLPDAFLNHFVYFSYFLFATIGTLFFALLLGNNWSDRLSALNLSYIYSFMLGQTCVSGQTQGCSPKIISTFSNQLLFLYVFFIAGITFLSYKKKAKFTQSWICGIISIVLLLLSIKVFLRPDSMAKDGLIQSVWITLAAIIFWRLAYIVFPIRRTIYLGLILAWGAIAYHSYQLWNFQKVHFEAGGYQYNIDKWKNFSYGFRENQYVDLIDKAYPTELSWSTAFSWSKNITELKLLLKQVFRDSNLKLKDTILCFPGAFISINADEKIQIVPEELYGALLVPIQNSAIITPRADFHFYLLRPLLALSTDINSDAEYSRLISKHQGEIKTYQVEKLESQMQITNQPSDQWYVAFRPK